MWSESDGGEIIKQMRHVYRNADTARELGSAAAARAAKFRWEDTTRKLVIALIQSGFIRPG
jgi:hypothetical protein